MRTRPGTRPAPTSVLTRGLHTIVSFHAHPDDEVLLTGGSLARAAAEGHRVVLVVATAGEAGLAASRYGTGADLGRHRLDELRQAADALRCARVELLGYADSGIDRAPRTGQDVSVRFADADVEQAAARLAGLLREEHADVLTVYDAAGGYGHPDHVQVHRVGVRAAAIAGTPVVLEATVDRDLLLRAVRLLDRLRRLLPVPWHPPLAEAFTARSALTHRVDVRPHTAAKRAALAAHASQATADGAARTVALLLHLPGPLFRLVLGHEWFVERGRAPDGVLLDDLFASLEPATAPADSRAVSESAAGRSAP